VVPSELKSYLAATIDWEAHVGIVKQRNYYRAIISVEQIGCRALNFLKQKTGLGRIYKIERKRKSPYPSKQILWAWQVYRVKEIKELLVQVYPYLLKKQAEVEVVLLYLERKISGDQAQKALKGVRENYKKECLE
jgi:hypothetical protein